MYSEAGKGTTSPAVQSPLSCRRPTGEIKTGGPKDSVGLLKDWKGTGTILLVDDEKSVCSVGKRMLEKAGFQVFSDTGISPFRSASVGLINGANAIEQYRKHTKEIVCVQLLDLTMPHKMMGRKPFGN